VGFLVDKVALGQIFTEFFGFKLSVIIPSMLHSLIYYPELVKRAHFLPECQGTQFHPTARIKK
jgi:hypothetical protein